MKNKDFRVQTFSSENAMLNFINSSESREPISVIDLGNNFYKLYYLW